MADFKPVITKRDNILSATNILNTFNLIYAQALTVQALLARYNTDPAFKVEVDHLFTAAQIAEMGQMITQVNNLQADWVTNHKGPLGLDVVIP